MIKTTTNSWPDVRLVVVGGTHRIHKGFTPVCDFFLQILTLRQAEQPSLETFKASFLSSNRHQISRANSFTPLGEVAIGCVDEFVSCFISTMYVALPGHSPTDSKSNASFSCSNSLSYLMKGAQKPSKNLRCETQMIGKKNITWFCRAKVILLLIYQVFVFDSPSPSNTQLRSARHSSSKTLADTCTPLPNFSDRFRISSTRHCSDSWRLFPALLSPLKFGQHHNKSTVFDRDTSFPSNIKAYQ